MRFCVYMIFKDYRPFVFNKEKMSFQLDITKLVYVGKTENIVNRMRGHRWGNKGVIRDVLKKYGEVSVFAFPCENDGMMNVFEAMMINTFIPEFNNESKCTPYCCISKECLQAFDQTSFIVRLHKEQKFTSEDNKRISDFENFNSIPWWRSNEELWR